MKKRLLCLFLALVMTFSVPVSAFADNAELGQELELEEIQVEEELGEAPETTEPSAEEPPAAEETPDAEEAPDIEESPDVEEAPDAEEPPDNEEAPDDEETPDDEENSETEGPVRSGVIGNSLTWVLEGDTLTVSGEGAMEDYEEASAQPWAAVGGEIVRVVLEDGVTAIGAYAFDGLAALKEITVPASVTAIGERAIPAAAVITGTAGSAAELYAEENGNTFEAVDAEVEEEELPERVEFTYINPLYKGIVTEEDLVRPSLIATYATAYNASSISDAGKYVRTKMVAHTQEVVFAIKSSSDGQSLVDSILTSAMAHTGVPNEGDYIAWNYSGLSGYWEYAGTSYTFYLTFTYFATASQEQQVTSAITTAINSMNLTDKTDYEKVKAIYDYICANVEYDYYGSDLIKHSTYAAIIKGKAVCQGYASLFYRMALTAGVDARVAEGYSSPSYSDDSAHGWNIVQMSNGRYYYVDSTWDSENYHYYGKMTYQYFLKGTSDFAGHYGYPLRYASIYYYDYSISAANYSPSSSDLTTGKATIPTVSVANASNGVKVSWNAVSGASRYLVYYKTSGGAWKRVANTSNTTFTWTGAVSGTTYSFSVRSANSSGTPLSDFAAGKSITYKPTVATPTVSVANATTGVQISWNAVSGASRYLVYYKTGTGGWSLVANTSNTSYTWTGAKNGTTYTFSVRTANSAGTATSDYAAGKSITYVAAPKISALNNTTNGVKITWGAVSGVSRYLVYYKTGSDGWTKVANTSNTTFTWTGAKSGTKYTFSVRCANSAGTATSGYASGISITHTPTAVVPTVSVANATTGVQISWNAVSGASRYLVYYKTGSGSWNLVANTSNTSYTWTGAKNGTTYTFSVRSANSAGTAISGYATGKSITYVAAPKISALNNTTNGVKITWGAVSGVSRYLVYYKTGTGGWTKVANTSNTSFTWTGAKSDTKYTFSVRCANSAGTATSGYASGVSITHKPASSSVSAPTISVANATTGVQISWGKVSGASRYLVYYKTGSGSWNLVANTSNTSFTWTGAKNGTTYAFSVRSANSAGTAISGYSTTKSITYIAAPKISSVANLSNGVKLSWGAVSGASRYLVYYKTGSGSWNLVANTSNTSFTWTGAKVGTAYTFAVRCANSSGVATSGYSNGISFTH